MAKREEEPLFWQTAYGRLMPLQELSHQHLSNIMYYYELIVPSGHILHPRVNEELNKRFLGKRLPYRPLTIFRREISVLVSKGYTTGEPDANIIVDGKIIGQVQY